MNDGNHSNGGMYSILVTIATGLHIIIYLIGKVIFGFFRRQNLKTEQRSNLNQQQNKTQEED